MSSHVQNLCALLVSVMVVVALMENLQHVKAGDASLALTKIYNTASCSSDANIVHYRYHVDDNCVTTNPACINSYPSSFGWKNATTCYDGDKYPLPADFSEIGWWSIHDFEVGDYCHFNGDKIIEINKFQIGKCVYLPLIKKYAIADAHCYGLSYCDSSNCEKTSCTWQQMDMLGSCSDIYQVGHPQLFLCKSAANSIVVSMTVLLVWALMLVF